MGITMIGTLMLVCLGCMVPSLAEGDASEQNGLEVLRPALPDGRVWVLGEGGVGRPFLARFLLANKSTQPIRIWDPENTEGARNHAVELTDASGKKTVLRLEGIERTGRGPTILTVEPNKIQRIDLELLRTVSDTALPAGTYELRLIYENRKESSVGIRGVWTGRVVSEPQEIRIEAPKRP